MMNKALYDLLLASFDRALSDEEQSALEEGLANSEELRIEKANLEKLRGLVAGQKHEFKPFFAGRVMNKIEAMTETAKEKGLSRWMMRMFPKVAISGLAVIVLFIAGTYLMEGSFSLETLWGISDVAAEDADYYLIDNF